MTTWSAFSRHLFLIVFLQAAFTPILAAQESAEKQIHRYMERLERQNLSDTEFEQTLSDLESLAKSLYDGVYRPDEDVKTLKSRVMFKGLKDLISDLVKKVRAKHAHFAKLSSAHEKTIAMRFQFVLGKLIVVLKSLKALERDKPLPAGGFYISLLSAEELNLLDPLSYDNAENATGGLDQAVSKARDHNGKLSLEAQAYLHTLIMGYLHKEAIKSKQALLALNQLLQITFAHSMKDGQPLPTFVSNAISTQLREKIASDLLAANKALEISKDHSKGFKQDEIAFLKSHIQTMRVVAANKVEIKWADWRTLVSTLPVTQETESSFTLLADAAALSSSVMRDPDALTCKLAALARILSAKYLYENDDAKNTEAVLLAKDPLDPPAVNISIAMLDSMKNQWTVDLHLVAIFSTMTAIIHRHEGQLHSGTRPHKSLVLLDLVATELMRFKTEKSVATTPEKTTAIAEAFSKLLEASITQSTATSSIHNYLKTYGFDDASLSVLNEASEHYLDLSNERRALIIAMIDHGKDKTNQGVRVTRLAEIRETLDPVGSNEPADSKPASGTTTNATPPVQITAETPQSDADEENDTDDKDGFDEAAANLRLDHLGPILFQLNALLDAIATESDVESMAKLAGQAFPLAENVFNLVKADKDGDAIIATVNADAQGRIRPLLHSIVAHAEQASAYLISKGFKDTDVFGQIQLIGGRATVVKEKIDAIVDGKTGRQLRSLAFERSLLSLEHRSFINALERDSAQDNPQLARQTLERLIASDEKLPLETLSMLFRTYRSYFGKNYEADVQNTNQLKQIAKDILNLFKKQFEIENAESGDITPRQFSPWITGDIKDVAQIRFGTNFSKVFSGLVRERGQVSYHQSPLAMAALFVFGARRPVNSVFDDPSWNVYLRVLPSYDTTGHKFNNFVANVVEMAAEVGNKKAIEFLAAIKATNIWNEQLSAAAVQNMLSSAKGIPKPAKFEAASEILKVGLDHRTSKLIYTNGVEALSIIIKESKLHPALEALKPIYIDILHTQLEFHKNDRDTGQDDPAVTAAYKKALQKFLKLNASAEPAKPEAKAKAATPKPARRTPPARAPRPVEPLPAPAPIPAAKPAKKAATAATNHETAPALLTEISEEADNLANVIAPASGRNASAAKNTRTMLEQLKLSVTTIDYGQPKHLAQIADVVRHIYAIHAAIPKDAEFDDMRATVLSIARSIIEGLTQSIDGIDYANWDFTRIGSMMTHIKAISDAIPASAKYNSMRSAIGTIQESVRKRVAAALNDACAGGFSS